MGVGWWESFPRPELKERIDARLEIQWGKGQHHPFCAGLTRRRLPGLVR